MRNFDLPVFSFKRFLERDENYPDHQGHTIEMCRAFVNFMDANRLSVARPYVGDDPPRDLTIRESQLSPEGRILFRSAAIDRWMGRNDDRGGSVDLNRFRAFSEWFSASVPPPPLRASAG